MNVSAYPWDRLPRMTRAQATLASQLARWLAAAPHGSRLRALVGGPAQARPGAPAATLDPFAARCVVRAERGAIEVRCDSMGIRAIAQRMLGDAAELDALRPLSAVEQSVWALVVATAALDLGVEAQVWPMPAPPSSAAAASGPSATRIALDVSLGEVRLAVELHLTGEPSVRARAMTQPPGWAERVELELPVVVARCAVSRDDLARLRVRDLLTLEPVAAPRSWRGERAELELWGGALGVNLRAEGSSGALAAEVVSGYGPRAMSVADDARIEVTVAVGTTRLSLRQVFELAVGQVVPLGRPLAGPFEVRAQGRVLGQGELVDVDGELAVRILSLAD